MQQFLTSFGRIQERVKVFMVGGSNVLRIDTGSDFSFRSTLRSHGWPSLAPFEHDERGPQLSFVFRSQKAASPVSVTIEPIPELASLQVRTDCGFDGGAAEAGKVVERVLALETDLAVFHKTIEGDAELGWIAETKTGRLMRSPTVFEDIVKTICTTNCTWAQTKTMVSRLVEKLGDVSPSGRKAFPAPQAIASADPVFLRDEIRAGYRGEYIREFAEKVTAGEVDPEAWAASDLPTDELKRELLAIKGVGKYCAEHMLKLLGRYDSLALDSFLRSEFYKKRNGGEKCPDSWIEEHYHEFGEWRGLVIWFDMCGP